MEKEKKYCCNKFRFLYSGDKSFGLNIRVIKSGNKIMERGFLKYDKSFYITEGYAGSINDEGIKSAVINYCPFCGKELRKLYGRNDDYVQETIEE